MRRVDGVSPGPLFSAGHHLLLLLLLQVRLLERARIQIGTVRESDLLLKQTLRLVSFYLELA